jgi:NAD(P)-dependent dehydrogenase (short-subunit alcohol dehydrogenase family)
MDALVPAHTFDGDQGLFEVTPASIDQHMAVNVRGFLLLMRGFAERLRDTGNKGQIVLFSSGPPQQGSIAYGASWVVPASLRMRLLWSHSCCPRMAPSSTAS